MIGETIGNFRVIERLGRGGMGEVFIGEQLSIQTRVAIKVLHREVSSDSDHVQRFFNEARIVSRIKHTGIVKIFDVGFHKEHAYLVMELLEGESLASRIQRGRFSLAQIANVGQQIASALAATHDSGVTHRDLKPDNIFLTTDEGHSSRERVKILDFGIAKLSGTMASASPRTVGTMGTPAYMAPEQWGDSGKVDWRADAYSLGCVAFEMATGEPPFSISSIAEACAKHLHTVPRSVRELVPELPPELDELIARLLAKAPAARGASMSEIAHAFQAVGGEPFPRASSSPVIPIADDAAAASMRNARPPISTISASMGEISVPRSRKGLAIGGIALAAIGAVVAIVVMSQHGSSSSPAERGSTAAAVPPPPPPVTPVAVAPPIDAAPPPADAPPPVDAAPPPSPHTIKPTPRPHAHVPVSAPPLPPTPAPTVVPHPAPPPPPPDDPLGGRT